MKLESRRRKYAVPVTFGLVILALILAFVAPEDEIIGSYFKIIYIHAAVTWVGLLTFAASGVFALAYFISSSIKSPKIDTIRSRILDLSSGTQLTAVIYWTASVVLGAVAAKLLWGGEWWIEPRFKVALYILVTAFVAYQIREIVKTDTLRAAVNFGLPAGAFILLATTGKLVHPDNAFAKTESVQIKLFAAIIGIVLLGSAISATSVFVGRIRDRMKRASKSRAEA